MSRENSSIEPFIPGDVALMVVRENVNLLKAWRLRLGMSVEQLAESAEIPADAVMAMENRENGFSIQLLSVARAMNLDIDQLVDN